MHNLKKEFVLSSLTLFVLFAVAIVTTVTTQAQVNTASTTVSTTNSTIPVRPINPPAACYKFTFNMTVGSVGADVAALQKFLQAKGFWPVGTGTKEASGYFGSLTKSALMAYQTSVGIPATGFAGPLTLAKLNASCTNPPVTPTITYLSPAAGTFDASRGNGKIDIRWKSIGVAATENVQIGLIDTRYNTESGPRAEQMIAYSIPNTGSYSWTIPNTLGTMDLTVTRQPVYRIVVHSWATNNGAAIGDSSKGLLSIIGPKTVATTTSKLQIDLTSTQIPSDINFVMDYKVTFDGTKYDPADVTIEFSCSPQYVLWTSVGGEISGGKLNQCSNLSNNNTGIDMQRISDGVYESKISFQNKSSQPQLVGAVAKAWGGVDGKTLITTDKDAFNLPVSVVPTPLPPVISGGTFPTQLNVGQQGTWTVNASDPQNGSLSYSVDWGDTPTCSYPYTCVASKVAISPVQSSTFTHTYSKAGTYKATFTVTNGAGLNAQTTSTVNVYDGTVQVIGTPSITGLYPSIASTGSNLNIVGSGFISPYSAVNFNGQGINMDDSPNSLTANSIEIIIPNDLPVGQYNVSVINLNNGQRLQSNLMSLNIHSSGTTTSSCPITYICTPIGTTSVCPAGYTCTPATVSCPSGYNCYTSSLVIVTPATSTPPTVSTTTPIIGTTTIPVVVIPPAPPVATTTVAPVKMTETVDATATYSCVPRTPPMVVRDTFLDPIIPKPEMPVCYFSPADTFAPNKLFGPAFVKYSCPTGYSLISSLPRDHKCAKNPVKASSSIVSFTASVWNSIVEFFTGK